MDPKTRHRILNGLFNRLGVVAKEPHLSVPCLGPHLDTYSAARLKKVSALTQGFWRKEHLILPRWI